METRFLRQMEKLNIKLEKKQQESFYKYYKMLLEWNRVMNLTGITDYDEVNEKHFIDSLTIVKVIDINSVNTVIDIGTGAGFPGIPLKIVYPHLNIVLLDSLMKRIYFLNNVISNLNLTNIETLHGRAEDYARKENYREKFDLCISRAVANLSTLSEYCIPYLRVGGIFISYKSGTIDDEVNEAKYAIDQLGGKLKSVVKFKIPETEISRSFVEIEKVKNTNGKYPRKAGIPLKEPLRQI